MVVVLGWIGLLEVDVYGWQWLEETREREGKKYLWLLFLSGRYWEQQYIGKTFPGIGNNYLGIGNNYPGIGNNHPGIGNKNPSIGNNYSGIGSNYPGIGIVHGRISTLEWVLVMLVLFTCVFFCCSVNNIIETGWQEMMGVGRNILQDKNNCSAWKDLGFAQSKKA